MGGNSRSKDITKTVRLSAEQWRRAKKAAAIETARTGVNAYPTVLIVDVGMDGIDAIIAAAQPQPVGA